MSDAELGRIVRELREARGMTQLELADRAGVALNSVWRLEVAKGSARLCTLSFVLEALGASITIACD